jgi:hypothetical protein
MNAQLTLNFVSEEEESLSSGVWVNMQQAPLPSSSVANLYDVYRMLTMAQTFLTAYSYTLPKIPFTISADGNTVTLPLSFYVFPSDLSLAYTLSNSIGFISGGSLQSLNKENSFVCSMAKKYTFDFLLEVKSLEWESPCYNLSGDAVSEPSYTVNKNEIIFSEIVFGVFRLKYKQKGYKHTATLSFTKSTVVSHEIAGLIWNQRVFNSITNTKCVIICTFEDEEGKQKQEILELKLPEFFKDFLKECNPGELMLRKNWSGDEQVDVYYSACTGAVLTTNSYPVVSE